MTITSISKKPHTCQTGTGSGEVQWKNREQLARKSSSTRDSIWGPILPVGEKALYKVATNPVGFSIAVMDQA